jgi:hypothetical protein
MGLDTSHDCWHGAYSAFTRWRTALGRAAGLPIGKVPLFGGGAPTIDWPDTTKLDQTDALRILIEHSDCDGEIPWQVCGPMADRLEALLPELEKLGDGGGHIGNYVAKTKQFIDGLRLASAHQEDVEFH